MQRSFGYSLKIGSSQVLVTSVKLAVVVVPIAEIFAGFFSGESRQSVREVLSDGLSLFIWQQIVFVFGAIFATICWELCHHFVQVKILTVFTSLVLSGITFSWSLKDGICLLVSDM